VGQANYSQIFKAVGFYSFNSLK